MADNSTKIVISAEDRASAAIKSVGNSLGQLNNAATSLLPQLGAFTGAASIGAMIAWSKGVIDAADSINDMSQRIGVSVKTLGEWKLAAEQNGTTLETMATGIKNLSVYMVDHADRLKAAGVASKDVKGVLMELSDIFKAMPEGPERTALAMEIFKKAGMEMLPVMLQGSKGLAEAAEKSALYAERLAELAPKADKFNDEMAELGLQSKAAGMNIADYLVGPMTELVALMNKLATGGPKAREAVEGLMNSKSPLVRGVAGFANWANSGDATYTGREVVGKIRGRVGGMALPGANSHEEAEALRRAAALNPSGGGSQKAPKARKSSTFDPEGDTLWAIQEATEKLKRQGFDEATAAVEKYDEALKKTAESLYAATDAGRFDKMNEEMDRAYEAFQRGYIKQDQLDAINGKLMETTDHLKDQGNIAKDLGMTFTSAFEDAVVGGKKFSDVLKGMEQDILRIIMRKTVTEPLGNAVSSMVKDFNWGSLIPSFDVGTDYVPNDMLAYVHKGEKITPAKYNNGGSGGVSIVVNNTASGVTATPQVRENNGRLEIEVLVAQAISRDMARNGPITQGFSGMFGLGRTV